jgi:hypothetical protein
VCDDKIAETFVVFLTNIEPWLMLFDQIRLQYQGFKNRIGLMNLHIRNFQNHRFDMRPIDMRVFQEIAPDPVLEACRFANIKNFSTFIEKLVNSRISWQLRDYALYLVRHMLFVIDITTIAKPSGYVDTMKTKTSPGLGKL